MQVTGIGRRSLGAVLFLSALMVGSGLAGQAVAQDQTPLQLDRKGSDSGTADATEPVLVVSIASLNKLMQDVNYITAAVGQPTAGGFFTMMAGGFAQGLDTTRPIGILVPIVDGAPEPIAMVPTPDAESMLKRLEAQGQIGAIDRLDDGTLVIAAGPSLVYIRQSGPWAVVARQKELLGLAPADPSGLLEDLGDNYTLSARLNVQEIPAETREGLIAQLRQGFEQAMAQRGGENTEDLQAASESTIKQLEQVIRESDQLMFGWNISPEEKIVTIDTEFIAAQGTEMAQLYGGQKAIASKFAHVINDEHAMYYQAAVSLTPKVIERSRESIAGAKQMINKAISDSEDLDADAKASVSELSSAVIDLIMQTIEAGKFDVGVQAIADDGQLEFAGGMFVSDGAKAEDLVRKLASKLENVEDAPTFAFDEGKHQGVELHSIKVDIPAEESEAREIFGEQAVIKVGTAPQALYFAIGKNSEQSLKEFIDSGSKNDNPTDRPLGQMQVSLLPFLRFSQSIKSNDVVAAMIDTLSQNVETDYVLVQSDSIENGQASTLEIGEGILKATGAAIREVQMQKMKQMQQQGGGQF
ncbi:MAG: hypothetical protein ACO1RT_07730 [Planctomycetaceae bacterium]